MKLVLLLFLSITSVLATSPKLYDGYEVYRVTPQSRLQLVVLHQLQEKPNGYDFWKDVSTLGKDVDIMVPPNLKEEFNNFTRIYNLQSKLWVEDVQQRIDAEKPKTPRVSGENDWKSYQTLDEINAWLDSLVLEYPDVVTPIVGGRSYQGREIRGVRLSYGTGKKVAFIEGGIHAREWISPATVTFMLNEFLTSEDSTVRTAVESRDWYIFPSVNPDGYAHTHSLDRLWRKTRKPYGSTCYGADPNRNWDYHWMEGGATLSPCLETNAGSQPFSEVETRTLSEFIDTIAENMDIYLSFHSCGQLILIPFGHSGREVPENNEELHRIGIAAAEKLAERYGTEYTVGNIPEAIYVASGGSIDWVLGKHRNVRLVYAFELRDKGTHCFLLPSEQIIPTGEETLDAVVKIVTEAGVDSTDDDDDDDDDNNDGDGDGDGAATGIFANFILISFLVISLIRI